MHFSEVRFFFTHWPCTIPSLFAKGCEHDFLETFSVWRAESRGVTGVGLFSRSQCHQSQSLLRVWNVIHATLQRMVHSVTALGEPMAHCQEPSMRDGSLTADEQGRKFLHQLASAKFTVHANRCSSIVLLDFSKPFGNTHFLQFFNAHTSFSSVYYVWQKDAAKVPNKTWCRLQRFWDTGTCKLQDCESSTIGQCSDRLLHNSKQYR